ncbi:MAG: hypothetical protein IKP77_01765 [Acholeplasmatales bacterium]|nr:hypothetical protein [Acholeplasmatales bacterium]
MKKMEIKKMLKLAASKQEINDLQKSILNRVDTSKVLNQEVIKAPKKKVSFMPFLISGVATAALLITLAITIGVNNTNSNTDGPHNDPKVPTINPTNTTVPTVVPTENIITENINTLIKNELNTQLQAQYETIQKIEVQNIVNTANTFINVSFNDYPAINKNLTVSQEEYIVDNYYIYSDNFAQMFGIDTSLTTLESNTDSLIYKYNKVIDVNSNNYNYKIYYDEELIEEKTSTSYKYKGNIAGVIVCGENEYQFEGLKRIKNDELIYQTTITIGENKYVEVYEDFSQTLNEFRFNYFFEGKEKNIIIKQSLNTDNSTKDIQFIINKNTNEINLETSLKNDSIECKIKSSNSDIMTVSNDFKTYKFKNSQNTYTK